MKVNGEGGSFVENKSQKKNRTLNPIRIIRHHFNSARIYPPNES